MIPRKTLAITASAALIAGVLLAGPAAVAVEMVADDSATPAVLPALQSWESGTGALTLTTQSRVVVADPSLSDLAELLADELTGVLGARPALATDAQAGDIVLTRGAGDAESYWLVIGDTVQITGADRDGAFYGTRTLLQLLRTSTDGLTLPAGAAEETPAFPVRAQMLDVGRKYFPIDYLKQQIRQMSWYKLNTFHLHLSDWNGYRIQSAVHPEIVSPEAYSIAELKDLERYAARYGVTIIPEIDLPGHSAAISKARPDLAFQCTSLSTPAGVPWEGASEGGWTLDVTKEETKAFSRDLVAEVADIFELSPYVHVGGDEIPGVALQNACPELVAYQQQKGYQYAFDPFVEYANMLNETVKSKGKQTVMWQWWDYQGQTSIVPDKDIIVSEWLSDPDGRAALGYETIGSKDGPLYVSPGFGSTPGDYGYVNVRDVYENYAFARADEKVLGYQVSRWSDRTQQFAVGWVDYFARRPLALVAERTWGTPAGGDMVEFLDRFDRIGDAPGVAVADPSDVDQQIGVNPGMLSHAGWTVTASDQETAQENGAAANAIDGDPYTQYHSSYSGQGAHWLQIDTGAVQQIAGLRYMPRQAGSANGNAKAYEIEVSVDGASWQKVAEGEFSNDRYVERLVPFASTAVRYVRFTSLNDHGAEGRFLAVAELDLVRSVAPPAAVEVSSHVRCMAGTGYLLVSARNTGTEPRVATIQTPYGTKTFAQVQPGKVASAALSTRLAQVPAGEISADGGAPVAYAGADCG